MLARELHRGDRVCRLAGLRDPDHQRVLRQDGVAVAPLAGDVRLDRDPGPLLDDVAPDDACVISGAARDDHDAPEIPDLELGQPDAVEHELPAPGAVADRLADRLGLFVDLLEHERLVAALFGNLVVPVDRLDVLVLDLPSVREEARALRRDRHDLPLVDQLHASRLAEERRHGRGEEHLAVADPDDERALPPRADEQIGMAVVNDDERVVAFELAIRGPHGLDQVAGVVPLDEVRNNLSVRLGAERVTVGLEGPFQLAKVLHDAVQHDGHVTVLAAGERMRVALVHSSVRRPACMSESMPRHGAVRSRRGLEVRQVADGPHVIEPTVLAQRDAG